MHSLINNIIKEMHVNNIFPLVDIKKYMYKMNSFYKMIEYKKSKNVPIDEEDNKLLQIKIEEAKKQKPNWIKKLFNKKQEE